MANPQIPQVPQQNPGQGQIFLPRVDNPFLSLWWTTQTVTRVPENVMGWLVAQGWEIAALSAPGGNPSEAGRSG